MATQFRFPFEGIVDLSVEQDSQVVHSMGSEFNPSWRHVDEAGHGHFMIESAPGRVSPSNTLHWVVEPCTMGHEDCEAEGHWECVHCGEVIQPGTRMARPLIVYGPRIYSLTLDHGNSRIIYKFGDDKIGELSERIREVIVDVLAEYEAERVITGP